MSSKKSIFSPKVILEIVNEHVWYSSSYSVTYDYVFFSNTLTKLIICFFEKPGCLIPRSNWTLGFLYTKSAKMGIEENLCCLEWNRSVDKWFPKHILNIIRWASPERTKDETRDWRRICRNDYWCKYKPLYFVAVKIIFSKISWMMTNMTFFIIQL